MPGRMMQLYTEAGLSHILPPFESGYRCGSIVFTVGTSLPGDDAPTPPFPVAVWLTPGRVDQPPLLAPTNRYQPPRNGYCQCTTRRNTGCYETSGPVGNIVSSETYEYQSWRGKGTLQSRELRMVFKLTNRYWVWPALGRVALGQT
jgi:hypothetical protein